MSVGMLDRDAAGKYHFRKMDYFGAGLDDSRHLGAYAAIVVPIEYRTSQQLQTMVDTLKQWAVEIGGQDEGRANAIYNLRHMPHRFSRRDRKTAPDAGVAFPETMQWAHPDYVEVFGGRLRRDEKTGWAVPDTNCAHFSVQAPRTMFGLPLEHIDPRFRTVQNINGIMPILKDGARALKNKNHALLLEMPGGKETPLRATRLEGKSPALFVGTSDLGYGFLVPHDLKQLQVNGEPFIEYAFRTLPVLKAEEPARGAAR